jgi:hypothetical protein
MKYLAQVFNILRQAMMRTYFVLKPRSLAIRLTIVILFLLKHMTNTVRHMYSPGKKFRHT